MEIFWDPEVVEKKQVTLTEAPGDLELARRKTAALPTIGNQEATGCGPSSKID